MKFLVPGTWSTLKKLIARDGPYDVVMLPPEMTFYRADWKGARAPDPGVPAFFSDWTTAQIYAPDPRTGEIGEDETTSSYTTTNPSKLFVLSESNFKALVAALDNAADKEFVTRGYLTHKLGMYEKRAPGLIETFREKVPRWAGDPISEDTTLLYASGAGQKLPDGNSDYNNRRLSRLICARGFDGWIAFPETLMQFDFPDWVSVYYPEVMFCNWNAIAARVGGRRRKTQRRKTKKRTTRRK